MRDGFCADKSARGAARTFGAPVWGAKSNRGSIIWESVAFPNNTAAIQPV